MKKNLRLILTFCFVVAIILSVIPTAMAADYNTSYFRYPTEAVYESFGKPGYAYGQLTVSVNSWVNNNEGGCPMDAVVYWANEDGKLPGYSSLARFKLSTRATTFEFSDLQIIPEGADRLIVYTAIHGTNTLSDSSVVAMLPENSAYSSTGEPIMSFVVLSDTHIRNDDNHSANLKFKDMLNDVKTLVPDAAGIFINGDNIQSNKTTTDLELPKSQLEKIKQYGQAICPDIPIFMGVGNHDLWPYKSASELREIFTNVATLPDGSHPDSVHYDFYLDGYHFVFIGDDDNNDPTYAKLSTETLAWLDETIAEGYDENSPNTFIFMHQAVSNTVAGSLTNYGQEWDGIINAVQVRNVLSKYPQAILFSGHSHYTMDSVQNAYSGGSLWPTNFNTASLASVTDHQDEAQGYIVEIYDDTVLVKGMDFAANEWKASAQYAVSYAENLGTGIQRPNNDVLNDEDKNDPKATKESADTVKSSEKKTEAQEGGCGSALGVGAMIIAVVPALICFVRKKEE